jgi:hypothetical protein
MGPDRSGVPESLVTSSATTGNIADVVANPLHRAFRILTEWFPDEARKLLRMPALTRYADVDPAQSADICAHAVTLAVSEFSQAIPLQWALYPWAL